MLTALLYGTRMRLCECLRVRVKDLDFERGQVFVHGGKGARDRFVPLPPSLERPLKDHLNNVRELHQKDLQKGLGEVDLPYALARKYPQASKEWKWQYVFPSFSTCIHPKTGKRVRFHLHPSFFAKHLKSAVKQGKLHKVEKAFH